jgi:hypothetical protein
MLFIIASGTQYRKRAWNDGAPHVLIEQTEQVLSNVAFLRAKKSAAQRRAPWIERIQGQVWQHGDGCSVAATDRRIADLLVWSAAG